MNSSMWAKFLAAVLLFAMWLALVITKIVPADPLVFAISQALVGLGVYHASTGGFSSKSSVTPLIEGAQLGELAGAPREKERSVQVSVSTPITAAAPPAPVPAPAAAAATLQ
ncbi:hypothetical protein [Paraburkholderia largidicola]|uniref:Uncharacterized protein n=1 Tax=Paraburkholderia largidicola TaxID=3014751 RepID=A0A7I8BJI8_9BURK|nr:hypothetical protein [Paraburkholderia sp. PGU16]BCF88655.1 hypothetical protein PPGU16_17220 [Paraburkholderia sp. PGU16]